MKTILPILLLLSITTSAQVHFSMNGGASTKGFVAGLNVGYTANSTVMIEYDQRAVLDRKNPGYFGARIGYHAVYSDLHQVTIMAGMHYRYFQAHDAANGMKAGIGASYLYYPPKAAVNSFIGVEAYYIKSNPCLQVKVGVAL